jgi:hypothetical protein
MMDCDLVGNIERRECLLNQRKQLRPEHSHVVQFDVEATRIAESFVHCEVVEVGQTAPAILEKVAAAAEEVQAFNEPSVIAPILV